ncbi:MAG: hypothetical protein HY800_04880 [Ignavibacteriales bacterium]|nr:hypothetical protein [Ignavibacteriales bacterium]
MANIKTAIEHHLKFENELENLIRYGLDVINNQTKADSSLLDEKKFLIEALLLRGCALWESFLERELVILVSLDTSRFIKEFGLIDKIRYDESLIRAILFSGMYRDFHDLDRSVSFYRKVVIDRYYPFTKLTRGQRSKLEFTYKIRNYLSHYSEYSKKKLTIEYKKQYRYRRFIELGEFLLKAKGRHFENLAHNFKLMSILMKKVLR